MTVTYDTLSGTYDTQTGTYDTYDLIVSGGQQLNSGQGSIASLVVEIALAGLAITSAAGTISANNDGSVALTGSGIVASAGVAATDYSRTLTGVAITAANGSVAVLVIPTPITGQVITSASGALSASSADVTVNITGVEAEFAQGNVSSGNTIITGQVSTSAAGTAVPSITLAITGIASTCGQGSVTAGQEADDTLITTGSGNALAAFDVSLIGSAIVSAAGTVAVTGDVDVALTGAASTSAAGTVGINESFPLSGAAVVSAMQSMGAPGGVTLTGAEITSAQGTIFTTGDRERALVGSSITVEQGNAVTSYLAFVTGQQLTISAQEFGPRATALTGLSISTETGFIEIPHRRRDAGGVKNKKRCVVEIDGEEFEVRSREEAEALLKQALELAESTASAELAKAAGSKLPRSKLVRVVRHHLKKPNVTVTGDVPGVQEEADEFRKQVDKLYEDAVRSAEIGVFLRKKQQETEDEFLVSLLL